MITSEEARSAITYSPETGTFRWNVRSEMSNRWNSRWSEKAAGTMREDGYISIRINGRRYYAHRLAWLITYGHWPKHGVDHINGDTSDNRIVNLRQADQRRNMQNLGRGHLDSTSRYLGVSFNSSRKKWQAYIWAKSKNVFLGYYDTEDSARDAYIRAKARLHEGYISSRFAASISDGHAERDRISCPVARRVNRASGSSVW